MAARVYGNRVLETTTTTGSGTLNLDGAATGFQSFVNGIGDGNECTYLITDDTDWEVGIGTVTDAATDTLSRDLVLASSNGGSKVSWSAGTKDVASVWAAQITGSISHSVQTITADPSPGLSQNGTVYLCDTSGGGFTVSLPAVATVPDGYTLTFIKTSDSNTLTLDGDTSETIDDNTTIAILNNGEVRTIVSNGTQWNHLFKSSQYIEVSLPAQSFYPDSNTPCANLTVTSLGAVDLGYLAFSSTGTQKAAIQITSPSNWDGNNIDIYFDWTSTAASGNAVWQSGLVITGDNEAFSTGLDSSGAVTDGHNGNGKLNKSAGITHSSLGFDPLDQVIIQAVRTPGSTADNLNADARFTGLRVRFKVI